MNVDEWLEKSRTLPDGRRMSDDDLSRVFDLVSPAGNWKMPIDARVPLDAATPAEIERAVVWYTGGGPDVFEEDGFWRVQAAGYYMCVGS